MTEFRQGWAVLARVTSSYNVDEQEAVDILRVFSDEADAIAEVERLQAANPNSTHLYCHSETRVELED